MCLLRIFALSSAYKRYVVCPNSPRKYTAVVELFEQKVFGAKRENNVLTSKNNLTTVNKVVVKSLFILAKDGHPFFKPFSKPANNWNTSALFTALKTTGKLLYADRQIESLRTVLNDNFSAKSLSKTEEIPELTEILHRILSA